MSDLFDDERLREGGELAEEAERAEQQGDDTGARELYARAAERYDIVALDVSGSPRARSVIAVSAVCLAARGGRFDRAIRYAERFLAEPGSLTAEGVRELEALLMSYRRALPEGHVERDTRTRPAGLLRHRNVQRRRRSGG